MKKCFTELLAHTESGAYTIVHACELLAGQRLVSHDLAGTCQIGQCREFYCYGVLLYIIDCQSVVLILDTHQTG